MALPLHPVRISEHFGLGRTQAELDFVDVEVEGDTRVFLSPTALRTMKTKWSGQCVSLIQNFFQEVLDAIKSGRDGRAQSLLESLREPNETHLGLSSGKPRGRALGPMSAREVWDSLRRSDAVTSGLLTDLEETVLMIDGIGADIVSDITTNIIRAPLIQYTKEACAYYGIPTERVAGGPTWSPTRRQWADDYADLPVIDYKRLLLVPKAIVRRRPEYDADEYTRLYLLEHLKSEEESNPNSSLVHILKDGRRRVYKTDVSAKYGFDEPGKKAIVHQSIQHRQVLADYRAAKDRASRPPSHDEMAGAAGVPATDWDALLMAVTEISPGNAGADAFTRAIEGLLSALFYPSLVFPQLETPIHQGRKRVDLTYENRGDPNRGQRSFFEWLAQHYTAPYMFVECKNYSVDISNPELDQLSGRFGKSRGEVGLLVCRNVDNRVRITKGCRDTAQDGRGYIVVLDDADLAVLVDEAKRERLFGNDYALLRQRFRELT